MQFSELISKQVVSLFDGKIIGLIANVILDEKLKRIRFYKIVDIEENEFYIKRQNIFVLGDYVAIKNTDTLNELTEDVSIIGKQVFDTDGKEYGNLSDIIFDKDFNVVTLITTKSKLENISVFNNKEVLILHGEKKIKNKNIKPNKYIGINAQNLTVNITTQPFKTSGNINLLLGRKIKTDIIGKNNEIIARKNQIITEKMIENAKNHNKIKLLMFNSEN